MINIEKTEEPKEFDWEKFKKGEVVVHFKKKEESFDFFEKAKKNGLTSGQDLNLEDAEKIKWKFCVFYNTFFKKICNYMRYLKEFKVIEWSDYMKNKKCKNIIEENSNSATVFKNAIWLYGARHQIMKTIEEMSELIKSLLKDLEKSDFDTLDSVNEEMADVYIMLEQLKMIYKNENEVEMYKMQKINRLDDRVNNYIKKINQIKNEKVEEEENE